MKKKVTAVIVAILVATVATVTASANTTGQQVDQTPAEIGEYGKGGFFFNPSFIDDDYGHHFKEEENGFYIAEDGFIVAVDHTKVVTKGEDGRLKLKVPETVGETTVTGLGGSWLGLWDLKNLDIFIPSTVATIDENALLFYYLDSPEKVPTFFIGNPTLRDELTSIYNNEKDLGEDSNYIPKVIAWADTEN